LPGQAKKTAQQHSKYEQDYLCPSWYYAFQFPPLHTHDNF